MSTARNVDGIDRFYSLTARVKYSCTVLPPIASEGKTSHVLSLLCGKIRFKISGWGSGKAHVDKCN